MTLVSLGDFVDSRTPAAREGFINLRLIDATHLASRDLISPPGLCEARTGNRKRLRT